MPVIKIAAKTVSKLPAVSKTTTYYDSDLTGFGLRIHKSGKRSWFIEYRPGAGGRAVAKRRMVFPHSSSFAPEEARKRASELLAQVRLGRDPSADRTKARAEATVETLLASYMDEKIKPKRKAGSAVLYEGYIRNHILPAFGKRPAAEITRVDVARLHRKVGAKTPVTANRLLTLLSAAYTFGSDTGLIAEDFKRPTAKIPKFPERSRERYLTDAELLLLGAALREAETDGIEWQPIDPAKPTSKHNAKENRRTTLGPHAVAAIRLLIFTGARVREILDLQWTHVDRQRGVLNLLDSKTGKKVVLLGIPALAVLDALPRVGLYVIAGDVKDKPRSDLKRPWKLISTRAQLDGVRLHDLRHSFASVGAGSGLGLPIIGKLLGHQSVETTQRYAHLADNPLRLASDAISAQIAKAMGDTA